MTREQRRQLEAVARYEDRYHKGLWAGRDGTTTAVLDVLAARDLLTRSRDDAHTRWWYRLTDAGREALEHAA